MTLYTSLPSLREGLLVHSKKSMEIGMFTVDQFSEILSDSAMPYLACSIYGNGRQHDLGLKFASMWIA